jgi:hypothetical protein
MAQRISIGFHASAPLATRVSDDELSRLQSALEGGGWHDLKVERDEQRVGFGIGG